MENFMIAGNAADSFREFCDQMPTSGISEFTGKTGRDCSCLMDFVEAWLQDGPGIEICNGDYGTYMIALVGIIDEWVNWPNITDYAIVPEDLNEEDQMVERRVSKIFDEGPQHRAFDRYCFQRLAFARMYPHATGEQPRSPSASVLVICQANPLPAHTRERAFHVLEQLAQDEPKRRPSIYEVEQILVNPALSVDAFGRHAAPYSSITTGYGEAATPDSDPLKALENS